MADFAITPFIGAEGCGPVPYLKQFLIRSQMPKRSELSRYYIPASFGAAELCKDVRCLRTLDASRRTKPSPLHEAPTTTPNPRWAACQSALP